MKKNLVSDSVQVKAKKEGKDTKDSTPQITQDNLQRIGNSFTVDHAMRLHPNHLVVWCMEIPD